MKLFIILVCIFAVVAAQEGKKPKEAPKSKNPICSKQLSVNAITCCPGMPSLQQFFDQCFAQCNAEKTTDEPTTAAKRGGKGGKQEKGKMEQKDDLKDQMKKCVMPCVLQAANILGPDGNISADALNAALVASASTDWADIVPSVTAACFANATAQAENPSKEKSDKPKRGGCINGKILKCTLKDIYLSCPSSVLVSSPECTDFTTKMTECPYEEGKKEGKGGKSEENKGQKNGKKEQESSKGGKGGKNEKPKGKPSSA